MCKTNLIQVFVDHLIMDNLKIITEIEEKYKFKITPEKNIRKEYFYRISKKFYEFIGKKKYFISSNTVFQNLKKKDIETIKILSKIDNMSSISVGFIINQIAKNLHQDDIYLNIGIYRGFSLLAGMLNTNCKVYGIDNYSHEYSSGDLSLSSEDNIHENMKSKEYFLFFFNKYKNAKKHNMFEIDYKDFFSKFNEHISFYYYDGDHSYKEQFDNLLIADKFLKKNSLILVDDYNEEQVEKATLEFISKNSSKYKVIREFKTANRFIHPTYGNGIILFEKHS